MDDNVTAYLQGKGVDTFQTSGDEVTVHCIFCSDGDPKGRGKLYVNTETWLFDCKRCGERGGRKRLLDHYGDADESTYEPGKDPNRKRAVLEEYCTHAEELLLANEARLLYLLRRGLSAETISGARLGYAPRNYGMTDSLPSARQAGGFTIADLVSSGMRNNSGREFFQGRIIIPYLRSGAVVQLRGKDPDGKYFTPPGDNVRLYGGDELRDADEVIITEGEFDALILRQHLRSSSSSMRAQNIAVVAIPGAGALPGGPDHFEDYFSHCKRIYLGLDPDETGKREMIKIKALLGARCRVLCLPDTERLDSLGEVVKCDWTEYLRDKGVDHPYGGHSWSDAMGLVTDADAVGRRVYSMADAGRRWARDENERPGIKFGFPTLDAILKPGLKPGNIAIPLAKTGCIQGDALIAVNRAGKGFTIKLRDLLDRWEGRKYAWDHDTDTYVQREVDGQVRLGRLINVWCSGVKTTYTVTTEAGRTLRATDEHPFLTDRGWQRLDQLAVGDLVHVRGQRGATGRSRLAYARRTVPLHPFAGRRGVKNGGHSVSLHRLVAEAGLNSLDLGSYLQMLRKGPVERLRFLDPDVWAVHHVDHDRFNNDLSNLKVLTHSEHAALHAAEGTTRNVQINVALERVVSVVMYGEEVTYDLEVADSPHNFLANGFVVHNTGKTVFLANVAYYNRHVPSLFITLEATSSEVYNILRRVTKFHHQRFDEELVQSLFPKLGIVDENRLGREDFALLIAEYADAHGFPPELVFVDYLGYYARGMPGGSPYEKTSYAVMQLKEEGKEHKVAIIAPHQVNRGAKDGKPFDADEARDSGVVEETADFVFGLFKPGEAVDEARATGMISDTLGCSILKSRRGGKGRVVNLSMSAASLAIVDMHDRLSVQRIQMENSAINRGEHYDDIYRRQRTLADSDAQLELVRYR